MTKELKKLMTWGLIRKVGNEPRPHGIKPAIYAAVPLKDVEAAATRYAAKKPRQRKRRAATTRISDLRQPEAGEWGKWYETRKHLIRLMAVVRSLDGMAYWEAAPADERVYVLEEMRVARERLDDAIVAFEEREKDDRLRDKIEKLEQTNGRTPAEAEGARRRAAAMREKLA